MKKRKYGNRKTTCFSQHLHDSGFEAKYCNKLLAMKQAGEIDFYLTQVRFKLYARITHIVDFVVYKDKKSVGEVHETKGFFTEASRMRVKMFRARYPQIKYILVRDTKKKRRKKWIGSGILQGNQRHKTKSQVWK